MENKSIVKTEYTDQEIKPIPTQNMREIFGMFRSISGAPTGNPVKFADQIVIDTTNARLYIYDTTTKAWKYTALT
jgi:hypothetical protein